ncbi:hypothetical protein F8388_010968 [Cannabis sativa]|uniref:Uncharacterized protein n=1 Tax=Cannabis sativa TaxID=3483 RepID=A0A7J6HNA6_CANSA|nr:hypothetical protein F8388_010968 [Cannabis sativa]KAF4396189.1 hypothetical protein G4B88_020826 [Cannabis sativa]
MYIIIFVMTKSPNRNPSPPLPLPASSSAVTTPTPTTISSDPDTFVSRFGPGADVLVEALEREGVTDVFASTLPRVSVQPSSTTRNMPGMITGSSGWDHSLELHWLHFTTRSSSKPSHSKEGLENLYAFHLYLN